MLFGCVLSSVALADSAIKLGAGTLGLGIGAQTDPHATWSLSLDARGAKVGYDAKAEDNNGVKGDELDYSGTLRLRSVALGLNRRTNLGLLSFGLMLNRSSLTNDTECTNQAGCELGTSRYQPQVLGTITTDFEFNPVAPFVGMGWGYLREGFGITLDIGAVYVGTPDVQMSSDGECQSSAECRAELDKEAKEREQQLSSSIYPMLTLGVRF